MPIVTTTREQNRAARLARRVGGYNELIRLAAERERIHGPVRLQRDQTGRLMVVAQTARNAAIDDDR